MCKGVKNLLKQNNQPLRTDSQLCFDYIENNIGNINEIVNIMIEMDFYFKYTKYSSIYRNQKYNYIDNMRHYMFYDRWDNHHYSLSNKDKKEISSSAKKKALKEWCMEEKDYCNAINKNYLPITLHDKVKEYFTH